MKVAVYGQSYSKESTTSALLILLTTLNNNDCEVHIESQFYEAQDDYLNAKPFTELDHSYDMLVSIGGDGTILRAVTFIGHLNIPIVGINTGRLGFLATISPEDIEMAIEQIVKKNYKISERSLLSVATQPENNNLSLANFALNEVAVSRKNTTSMIIIETYLDDEYLTSYWADGLIISTPTGSTGYSLSCGGPVITPKANNFVLTPIAPHNLNARPLVIPDNTEIRLRVDGREDHFLMSLDSRIVTISNETTVHIKKAEFVLNMVELSHESFLGTLRKKLLWGEDKRN